MGISFSAPFKQRPLWLILISLISLGVFEGIWLRKVWQEQYDNLVQETDYVFQQTVSTLQDSMVRRSLVKSGMAETALDSCYPPLPFKNNEMPLPPEGQLVPRIPLRGDAQMVIRMGDKANFTVKEDSIRYDQVQVFIATATDSFPADLSKRADRQLIRLTQQMSGTDNFNQIFRLQKSTISITELENSYRENLRKAGIALPFEIIHRDSLPFVPAAGAILTQPAVAGLLVHRFYAAHFGDYQMFLLRRSLPALFFALLLFGITSVAFLLIYRSLRQQQRLTRLKNEFISNITHELKTPITTVGVALEALSDFEALQNPEKTREYLSLSKLELDRLSLLVEKVLRLSMFEEQPPSLKPETIDLAALLRQVVAAMTLQAERAGAVITVNIPEDSDFTFQGDRLHLSSVIFNLLDNALKYTEGKPLIVITLEKQPGTILLSVRDNGIGIPADLQARVFDKFFRVPRNNRHDVKGHGLGLNYTAHVVRQHGGTIRVESTEGEGTVFTVELPAG